MLSKVNSATITGMNASLVVVEVDLANGIPSFSMTGYLGMRVKESAERVRTAIKNVGYQMPYAKIVVNVSPASIRKNGSMFDLPIAVAILCNMGVLEQSKLENVLFLGELSLDGSINRIRGVLPMIDEARKQGIQSCMIPKENMYEASLLEGIRVFGVSNLNDVIHYFQLEQEDYGSDIQDELEYPMDSSGGTNLDFSDVSGQYMAKRAILIAAAGTHNLIMSGPPGSGKTMLASRIPSILPDLSKEEFIEVNKIYSVAGKITKKDGNIIQRPFRSPHHTITKASLIGGGSIPIPGELSLAHKGVLFLDELTKFRMDVLDSLRQPLETREINLIRGGESYTFPAEIMLVAAMNPCQCGFYPDRMRCNCSEYDIARHYGRISKPFLDRFDMTVSVQRPEYEELIGEEKKKKKLRENDTMNSAMMKKSVMQARLIQQKRYENLPVQYNSQLNSKQMKQFCVMEDDANQLLKQYYEKKNISARGYSKIIKVARTIADLESSERIQKRHISEAICLRGMD